jgi:hypothetical protein
MLSNCDLEGLILAFLPTGSVHPFSMCADMFSLHLLDLPSFCPRMNQPVKVPTDIISFSSHSHFVKFFPKLHEISEELI